MLRFRGSQCFRQRMVCATIAGKPIRIDDIRADDESPGLRDYEASLLRLIEKITNGCIIEINETGASRALACMYAWRALSSPGSRRATQAGGLCVALPRGPASPRPAPAAQAPACATSPALWRGARGWSTTAAHPAPSATFSNPWPS